MQPIKQEHSLFSVLGQKLAGPATALILAGIEADAEFYALHELGFVTVSATTLVSDSVYSTAGWYSSDAHSIRSD